MLLSDAIVACLELFDVEYVFGVSGANIEHLHDAIHRRGRIRSVLARSESGAAYMADCHARVGHRLGVCCSTSGGGMMNLVAGVAEAHQSAVPLLAIVGQPPSSLDGRGAFQDSSGIGQTVDAYGLFSAVSKFTGRVHDSDSFWSAMEHALVACLAGRRAAAVLLIPRNRFVLEVGDRCAQLVEAVRARIERVEPSDDDLLALLAAIRTAKRPVMIVGEGVERSSAEDAVSSFARDLGLPVATTMGSRGVLAHDHASNLGVLGVAGHPSVHDYLREECDLLFVVGTALDTMTRAPFAQDAVDLPAKRLIALDEDTHELRRVVASQLRSEVTQTTQRSWWPAAVQGIDCTVDADIRISLERMRELWSGDPFHCGRGDGYELTVFEPSAASPSLRAARASIVDAPPSAEPLRQSDALRVIARHLPLAGTLLYDAGNCASAALHFVPLPRNVRGVIALGMGAMGFAIAGATGAQLAQGNLRRSVVLAGDGAFLMQGFEIHTAAELALPILFVIFNNAGHGMCATRQERFFEGRFESVFYPRVDIAAVARGLAPAEALWVGRADSVRSIDGALSSYERSGIKTGVLELVIDIEEAPPFTPLLPKDSPTVSLATWLARADRRP